MYVSSWDEMNVGRQASKEGNESHRPLKEREHATKIDEASGTVIVKATATPVENALSPFMDLGPRFPRSAWCETTKPLSGGCLAGRQIDEA